MQFCFGVFSVVWIALRPCKFLNRLFVRGWSIEAFSATVAGDKLGRVRGLHLQAVETWRVNLLQSIDLLWCALTLQRDLTSGILMCLVLHTSLLRGIIDVLAFFIIFVAAKKQGMKRHPKVPSLLDAILRDATTYFMFIFFVHFLSQLFMFVAPVRDAGYTQGSIVLY